MADTTTATKPTVRRCPCGRIDRVHDTLGICPRCFRVLWDFINWVRDPVAFDRDRAHLR